MKKLYVQVSAVALLAGVFTAATASADGLQLSPVVLRLFATKIHGTLDMSAAKKGEFASMTCDKLSVAATSVAQNPCTPGSGFCVPTPKWVHTEMQLTAGQTPTTCSYSILVPAAQPFGLSVNTQVNLCGGSGLTMVSVKPGPSTGQLSVPVGGSKEADLLVTAFTRECIN
jgi:hypothetical protein